MPSPGGVAPRVQARRQHAIGRLVYSQSTATWLARRACVVLGVVVGIVILVRAMGSLLPPRIYSKDILQEYLLVRAVLDGSDPYLPIPKLAERYLGPVPVTLLPHPTPHPPPAAIIFLPFSLLDYYSAAWLWFGLEIVWLFASIYALGRIASVRLSALATCCIGVTLMAWPPVYYDLLFGQLMLALLLLLAGAQLALMRGRLILGGVLVGLSILLKPIAWPILLLLCLRRNWSSLVASIVTTLLGYTIAGSAMGFDRVATYFRDVAPLVSSINRAYTLNFSLWTLGWKLFDGTGSPVFATITAPPLVRSTPTALATSAVIPTLALAFALWVAYRQRDLAPALGVVLCASILVSPIAWSHYLVLTMIPATYVVQRLVRRGLPSGWTNSAVIVAWLLWIPDQAWTMLALLLASQPPVPATLAVTPFAPALVTLAPAVALGALAALVTRLGVMDSLPGE